MEECFFCSEKNEIVLEEHHLVPKKLYESVSATSAFETVTLCANCHKKLHSLLRPLEKYFGIEKVEVSEAELRLQKEDNRRQIALRKVLDAIEQTERNRKPGITEQELEKKLGTAVAGFQIPRLINALASEGVIYEPKKGVFRKT